MSLTSIVRRSFCSKCAFSITPCRQRRRPAKTVGDLVRRGITPSDVPPVRELMTRREREVREGKLRGLFDSRSRRRLAGERALADRLTRFPRLTTRNVRDAIEYQDARYRHHYRALSAVDGRRLA